MQSSALKQLATASVGIASYTCNYADTVGENEMGISLCSKCFNITAGVI